MRRLIHHIYNIVLLSRDRVSASPWVGCFWAISPKTRNKSLKHSTNLHRTLHVLPITLCFLSKTHKKTPKFYPKRTKTDHRTAWKAFKTAQKYRNWLKLDKIFLSHYQVVEVLEQKKDFKIFGQNRKRQYFCNPKRRGKQGERRREERDSRRGN